MIISWNVRGLNKVGKSREIRSRLQTLHPAISVLIETRVKKNKAHVIRERLRLTRKYPDNYDNHENGRIWICWSDNMVHLEQITSTNQLIRCKVHDTAGNFLYWLAAIYAQNQLELRRKMWQDIDKIHSQQQGFCMLIGDFNNFIKIEDRIGGNMVTKKEYIDLVSMMSGAGLYELEITGDYFTWSNKQGDNAIYSRIDRVLRNMEWMQDHMHATLTNITPIVSDHAMLMLREKEQNQFRTRHFKFINNIIDLDNLQAVVLESRSIPLQGRPMFVVWKKIQRLQPLIRNLCKPITDVNNEIIKAREYLL